MRYLCWSLFIVILLSCSSQKNKIQNLVLDGKSCELISVIDTVKLTGLLIYYYNGAKGGRSGNAFKLLVVGDSVTVDTHAIGKKTVKYFLNKTKNRFVFVGSYGADRLLSKACDSLFRSYKPGSEVVLKENGSFDINKESYVDLDQIQGTFLRLKVNEAYYRRMRPTEIDFHFGENGWVEVLIPIVP